MPQARPHGRCDSRQQKKTPPSVRTTRPIAPPIRGFAAPSASGRAPGSGRGTGPCRSWHPGDLLRRSLRDHGAAGVSPLRTQIDDVVGGLDHIQVVLDHQHRVAVVHQAAAARPAGCDVVRCAGRWSVRPGCTGCGRCSAGKAPRPVSPAGPPRRRGWWPVGPAGCSPDPRRAGFAAFARCGGCS